MQGFPLCAAFSRSPRGFMGRGARTYRLTLVFSDPGVTVIFLGCSVLLSTLGLLGLYVAGLLLAISWEI